MNSQPTSVLYTQDAKVVRRIQSHLVAQVKVVHVAAAERLVPTLQLHCPALLILDIMADDATRLLRTIGSRWPENVTIVLGPLMTDTMDELESHVYAVEDLHYDDYRRFQSMVRRALQHLDLTQQLQMLREQANGKRAEAQSVPAAGTRTASTFSFGHLTRAFRNFGNVEALLKSIVEAVSESASVSRVGIFTRSEHNGHFRYLAGIRCLPETQSMSFPVDDAFVQWLEINAHLVSRSTIDHVLDLQERRMLRQSLDLHGCEVIVPLHARERLGGWLFLGHRVTGLPFEIADLEMLMTVAEYISTTLENALLYEEIAVQKPLTDALLHHIPTGIVVAGNNCIVRCVNRAAERILCLSEPTLNQPIRVLGTRVASLLTRSINGDLPSGTLEWIAADTNRTIAATTQQLCNGDECIGAVVLLQDLTAEHVIREKEEHLERAKVVAELAATMSHEIRNPLVTIKTYAQLLPERRNDDDFCGDFNELVLGEVDRLVSIIEHIQEIAQLPSMVFTTVTIADVVRKAVDRVVGRGELGQAQVDVHVAPQVPAIEGDEYALIQCLWHLLDNALNAQSDQRQLRISISVKPVYDGREICGVRLNVQDNGVGIPEEMQARVFSPFCTTREKDLGMGLTIVKRTVVEHHGSVEISSNSDGTLVTLTLLRMPANDPIQTYSHR